MFDWLHRNLVPDWAEDRSPDHEHPHRRRFTASYRRKRGIVKNVWIGSGLLMIALGSPPAILGIALGTVFLSFMILDETR
jgi:hypothetical protein